MDSIIYSVSLLALIFLGLKAGVLITNHVIRIGTTAHTGEKYVECTVCGKCMWKKNRIKLFSWLFGGGVCRECKSNISSIYAVGELIGAIAIIISGVRCISLVQGILSGDSWSYKYIVSITGVLLEIMPLYSLAFIAIQAWKNRSGESCIPYKQGKIIGVRKEWVLAYVLTVTTMVVMVLLHTIMNKTASLISTPLDGNEYKIRGQELIKFGLLAILVGAELTLTKAKAHSVCVLLVIWLGGGVSGVINVCIVALFGLWLSAVIIKETKSTAKAWRLLPIWVFVGYCMQLFLPLISLGY